MPSRPGVAPGRRGIFYTSGGVDCAIVITGQPYATDTAKCRFRHRIGNLAYLTVDLDCRWYAVFILTCDTTDPT
jgi:hypothetical protein